MTWFRKSLLFLGPTCLWTILLMLCPGYHLRAQWMQVNSGTSLDLYDVHFVSQTTGYAVGDSGMVLRTTDAGDTWTSIHMDPGLTFVSVFFTTLDTGYAAAGNLYRTYDGGLTWVLSLTDPQQQMMEVYFVNRDLGFASGRPLQRTTDGGDTWTSFQLNNVFSSIYFPSDSVGYFVGGPDFGTPLYKTLDAGQSFQPIANGFQSIKEATYFLNDSVGYMCGWYGGIIVKTTNGGGSWQDLDPNDEHQAWDVYFENELIGYHIDNAGGYARILKTTDGGLSWLPQLVVSGIWLNALHRIGPQAYIAVGENGSIYKTTNGGGVGSDGPSSQPLLGIHPNPMGTQATLFTNLQLSDATLTIIDAQGRALRVIGNLQGQDIPIQLDGLPSGIYLFRITENGNNLGTVTAIIGN